MKILSVLTYYRPHTSGLTIFAERHAKALARRGHEVTVLTSQYDKDTPLEEMPAQLPSPPPGRPPRLPGPPPNPPRPPPRPPNSHGMMPSS